MPRFGLAAAQSVLVSFAVEKGREWAPLHLLWLLRKAHAARLHARYGRVYVVTVEHDRRLALSPVGQQRFRIQHEARFGSGRRNLYPASQRAKSTPCPYLEA